MSNVYLAVPGAPDRLLGHGDDDGKVYRSQAGLDDLIGRVDLATGAVYEHRFGPDKKVGHVDLSSGRVYLTRLAPDTHVGQVNPDGRMYRQQALAADDCAGNVEQFRSYAHSAGALLLLVLPALDLETSAQEVEESIDTENIP